ncbi:MAG: hypothetical protein D6B28_08195 [Gammaproteobacteria bacterium]|nr:MAG: hypothetical protein D6B28_08195 [Gammaproteobacteria bacterium]
MCKGIYVFLIISCYLLSSAYADNHRNPSVNSPKYYHWPLQEDAAVKISQSIEPPEGYTRITLEDTSFGTWLRALPLLQNSNTVHLFNGDKKFNQLAQHSIIDIDVGDKDLQQCADAAIRLRAEFLFSKKDYKSIHFNFTSGDNASWEEWAAGKRPVIKGNKVSWVHKSAQNHSYANFRKYLETVFTYAGSASLSRELETVPNPAKILPGDIFIQGGYPGHAVIVMDVAENSKGERVFLLAQSYMPAQQVHLLRNPKIWNGPWYHAKSSGKLVTPEWIFNFKDLMRF